MNDNELDALMASANPVSESKMAALDIKSGAEDLLEAIMSETTTRSYKRLGFAGVAVAAVVAIAIGVAVIDGGREEREVLHNWEVQQIYVKQKDATIGQYVTETIITLRWYLVNNIIDDLKNNLSNSYMEDNISLVETDKIQEMVQRILRQTDYSEDLAREKLKETNMMK